MRHKRNNDSKLFIFTQEFNKKDLINILAIYIFLSFLTFGAQQSC